MSKFLMTSKRIGVNAAASKLFPAVPNEEEVAHLLENRAELSFPVLLEWHLTGDGHAPRQEVIEHLRRDEMAWMKLWPCLDRLPSDRLRDWLASCGETAPYAVWIRATTRLASPIGRKIVAAIEHPDVNAVPGPAFDPRFLRILVEHEHDPELVTVVQAWLRACDDELRCRYLCLFERAGVLGDIPEVTQFLPWSVVPAWPPTFDGEDLPIANVAHWLALQLPESQRASTDAWIVEQYLSAVRSGADWFDLFWRIPPRVRTPIALASLDLDPTQWSPFTGVALAQRIHAGDHGLWPRAMQWLERVWKVRVARRAEDEGAWMTRELEVRDRLRDRAMKKSAGWELLTERMQCQLGPLFPATPADGADGTHVFHPVLAGIHALENAPLPADEPIDRAWAGLYGRHEFGLELLKKRFEGPLVHHRAELLLEAALRTGVRGRGSLLEEVVALTGHVPIERAPDGDRLFECDVDQLRAWREAAGPAFDARIDGWIFNQLTKDPSSRTLNRARVLGRPLREEWKRTWRTALTTWRFGEVLRYRHEEPWLVRDGELVGLVLARLAVEGESVFRCGDLPDELRPVVAEHVTRIEDDRIAADLLAWLARADPRGTDALALERLRARPGPHACEWWGHRLSSTQQWNEHGADVIGSLLGGKLFDLAWHVIDSSRGARAARVVAEAEAQAQRNGRPRKQPDESKFVAAIHLAIAKAICGKVTRDIEDRRLEDVERGVNALCALEPPPLITHDLESVLRALRQTNATDSSIAALEELKQITRAGAPEADYADLHIALHVLAGHGEVAR